MVGASEQHRGNLQAERVRGLPIDQQLELARRLHRQVGDPAEIDATVGRHAGEPTGLVLPPDPFTVAHRERIVTAAARHRVPVIYPLRYFIDAGGLMSYGAELEVRSGPYINLILRGAKVAELPIQSPRKYELLINRRVAQALGLTIPLALLARADQIVE